VNSNSAKPNQKIERLGSRDKKIWEELLLCMALFPGRRPHYRPWMELFCK
jgi:hypothetical protein